jgi:hypothetical protein
VAPPGYRVDSTFDTLGRPVSATEVIAGQAFTQSTTYDAQSRPSIVSYASGLRVRSNYDASSTLSTIDNPDSGLVYFQRLDFDARGNVTKSKLGRAPHSAGSGRYRACWSTKSWSPPRHGGWSPAPISV